MQKLFKTFILLSFTFGITKLSAKSFVIVENLTTINFNLEISEINENLNQKYWKKLSREIEQGSKKKILSFNRDSGIKNKKYYHFETKLIPKNIEYNEQNILIFRQQLLGRSIRSHLYQGLSISCENNIKWFDDKKLRSRALKMKDRFLKVSFSAVRNGLDDNIIYRIEEIDIKNNIEDEKSIKILNYNTYMRPIGLFKNGQDKRSKMMIPYLQGYDLLVLSELFDDDIRNKLINGLSKTYPFQSSVIGSDQGLKQDGGVIVLSKWPILSQKQRLYGSNCAGINCFSRKGVLYTHILKGNSEYHVFSTHMQSGQAASSISKRKIQLKIVKDFIKDTNISKDFPVFLVGDLNIDSNDRTNRSEYSNLLDLLSFKYIRPNGHNLSFDPSLNELANPKDRPELVDLILYSEKHLQPTSAESKVIILKTENPWRDYFWEQWFYDLSDHFPVEATISF